MAKAKTNKSADVQDVATAPLAAEQLESVLEQVAAAPAAPMVVELFLKAPQMQCGDQVLERGARVAEVVLAPGVTIDWLGRAVHDDVVGPYLS